MSSNQGQTERTTDNIGVRLLFADQLNLARGKYISIEHAKKGRARITQSIYAITYNRQIVVDAPGTGVLEGVPDMDMVFDPQDIRKGWDGVADLALVDLYKNGKPFELCARNVLKAAIDDWRALGLEPMIGLEGEAFLFEKNDAGVWVPYNVPGSFCYGCGSTVDPHHVISQIWRQADECDISVESINSEFDDAQFELTLEYTDALKACDDFFLFRTLAREVAVDRGYLLSFLPKPLLDRGGSGLHVNISFVDSEGKNAFTNSTNPDNLSTLVKGCIAGLMTHHEALGGLLAPTVNSYQRLQPGQMSGYWANWAHDHRGVAVRVSAEEGESARLEHRLADCAANPYLVVAAILQAARLGVIYEYELQAEEKSDTFMNTDATRHVERDLQSSINKTLEDEKLVNALGRTFVENYATVKRWELEEIGEKTQEETIQYYLNYI